MKMGAMSPVDDLPPRRGAISAAALQQELLRRADEDLTARAALIAKGRAVFEQSAAVDADNTAWLKGVLDEVGWPGKSMVGEEAAHATWLLAQHADKDLPFQRRCLALLMQAAAEGEASPSDAARLTDRVRLAEGKSQVYGTQMVARHGRYEAPRLGDPNRVDERRAAMGLEPLADQIVQATEVFGPPEPVQSRCRKCDAPIELWLPEPEGSTTVRCSACGFTSSVRARIRSSA